MMRKATAVWCGSGRAGRGDLSSDPGVLANTPCSFRIRFENEEGTRPEESIAAAHSGCLAMALAFRLQGVGSTSTELNTEAVVTIEQDKEGYLVSCSALTPHTSQSIQSIPGHLALADPLIQRFERWARGLLAEGFSLERAAHEVFAELARRHPRLQVQASYGDRFVDVAAEGFDCAVRVGHLPDSNLVARRVASMRAKLVASPDYIRRHGTPETPEELLLHEALLQGTDTWRLIDGPRLITVRPQGRFKADNAVALAAAAVAGLGIAKLPDCLTDAYPPDALIPVMT
jgi:OsmC subfamily peroxiredoxin